MVWKETCAVDERMRFVMAIAAGEDSFAATCRRFGVSRGTGYKWFERYWLEGVSGLADRSRAPQRRLRSLSDAIAEACLAVRRTHPRWGPVKVRAWLQHRDPGVCWPAASTIGTLFDRAGLTVKCRVRRRAPARSSSASSTIVPRACDDQDERSVGLWITPSGYPQPHRPNNRNAL